MNTILVLVFTRISAIPDEAPPSNKLAFGRKKLIRPPTHASNRRGPDTIKIKRRSFCYFNVENNNAVVNTILYRVQSSNKRPLR